MVEFEADGDYWLMKKSGEYDCIEEIDEDYINDLCEQADYYGMESLTEEEQYLLLSRPLVD